MVEEHGQTEHDEAPAQPEAPRRRRAARRPAGPPVTHPELSGPAPDSGAGHGGSGETAAALEAPSAQQPTPKDEGGDVPGVDSPVAESPDQESSDEGAQQPGDGFPGEPEHAIASGSQESAEEMGEAAPGDQPLPASDDTETPVTTSDDTEAPVTTGDDTEAPVTTGDDIEGADAAGDDTEAADVGGDDQAAATTPDGQAAAGVPEAAVDPAQPTESSDASADAGPEPVTEPRARRSRRATRGVTAPFSSPHEAPAQSTRPADRPAPALFQAPDLTSRPAEPTEPRPAATAPEPGGEAPDGTLVEPDGQGQSAGARRARRATRAAGAPSAPPSAPESDEVSEPARPEAGGPDDASDADDDGQPRRRRRRGGRRRKRPGFDDVDGAGTDEAPEGPSEASAAGDVDAESTDSGEQSPSTAEADTAAADETDDQDDEESGTGRRRRRRRRRAGVSEEMEDLSTDDPPNTVTKVRESRRPSDEVVGVRGSTRIEAKKQRRRDGREAGRRRAPILTEAEFLARRESVNRVMCVRQHGDRTQIAVLEDGILVEHYVNRAESSSMVGNVYLGKVQNVLPSMEAAFIDIGRGRNAVLYAGEVNWDAAGMEGQPKRIELALKSGDPVLVQVTKDPIGHKGARLTSQISLPGRFLVYVPEGSMTGISRKLPDTERARLKGILKDVVPDGAGVIVRTAAEGATEEQLTSDVQRLTDEWADIQRKVKSSTPPTLLYGEPDLAIKVVRDIFNEDFTTLLVQGEATAGTLRDYIGRVAPDLLGRVEQWTDIEDLYTAHRIDEQLAKALDRKVWLPSGGSLVIDRTEAMTVIDVNTGKFTGQGGNLEETVTRNNLEAAEETVRQLRLRDIGGIIVIDFIDMVLESNRDLVLRRLVECLGRDRTKHQVAEVTSLGLVQMTRKRIGQGLLEVFSTPCEACGGRGHIVHTEPVGSDGSEEPSRGGRDRGNGRRAQRSTPPTPPPHVTLGGKQTGKTPPPPRFDEHGHIDHSGDHPDAEDEHAGPNNAEPLDFELPDRIDVDGGGIEADLEYVVDDAERAPAAGLSQAEAEATPDTEQVAAEPVSAEPVSAELASAEHHDALFELATDTFELEVNEPGSPESDVVDHSDAVAESSQTDAVESQVNEPEPSEPDAIEQAEAAAESTTTDTAELVLPESEPPAPNADQPLQGEPDDAAPVGAFDAEMAPAEPASPPADEGLAQDSDRSEQADEADVPQVVV